MPCIIHFYGDEANVTELLKLCPIEPCNSYRKGEARSNRPNAHQSKTSGVGLVASDADFDFFGLQKSQALAFIRLHMSKLQEMRAVSGVEVASIDFGISMRNVIVQTDYFESELLIELAALRIRLALSQYPIAGKDKRIKQYRRVLRKSR